MGITESSKHTRS